jgi:protein-L-isoaspartate(D-aspartate) O-methyltransferase
MATSTETRDRQEQMLRQQVIERGISDSRVLDAMRRVPRDRFFSGDFQRDAFADRACEIGHGQTISQPFVVALMTQQLDLKSHHRVLEIGTGSGYQTAVLARMAREVCTIERIKPLLDDAFDRILSLELKNVHFHFGDGFTGWPDRSRFDRIIFTAAPETLPEKLILDTLVEGGVAVLPVGGAFEQKLERIERRGDELKRTPVVGVSFVPMVAGVTSR